MRVCGRSDRCRAPKFGEYDPYAVANVAHKVFRSKVILEFTFVASNLFFRVLRRLLH